MSKLSSRTRMMIVTTVLAVAYFILQESDFRVLLNLEFNFDPIKPFILSLLAYLGGMWALFFKVRGERLVTILLFPAIGVFALSLFAELVILAVFSELGQFSLVLVSSIFFWVFTYIMLLTINILNAAHEADIPLGQAARASQFVLTLVISYIVFFLLFSNDLFILFKLSGFLLLGTILVYIALWSINMRVQQRFTASLGIGILLTFAGSVLSVWPVPSPYLALALSLLLYVTLGISLEIREIISRWVWVEYISLFILIAAMLSLVAEWGINGTLI
ncbi:MAG: hypothetical protein ACE5DX_00390 [Candidatus Dojkabacteria bacterium]